MNRNRQYATDSELAVLDACASNKDATKRVLEGVCSRLSSSSGSGTPSDDDSEETRRLHLCLQMQYAAGVCAGENCHRHVLDTETGVLEWHHPIDTGKFKRWVSWIKAASGEAGIAAAIREIEEQKLQLLCRSCHRMSHTGNNQQHTRRTVLATEEEQLLLSSELVTDNQKKRCMREAKRLAI